MRIFIDSADLADIERYADDPAISGFTTNATLVKRAGADVEKLVVATGGKEISVEAYCCEWQPHVRWKTTDVGVIARMDRRDQRYNYTAICSLQQIPAAVPFDLSDTIFSVFAGRIMDTGRAPRPVIDAAKATGAQVLWASSRAVYDITMAERMGCDIITVTPAIYEKYREWDGMDLEEVARLTIAQFERDR